MIRATLRGRRAATVILTAGLCLAAAARPAGGASLAPRDDGLPPGWCGTSDARLVEALARDAQRQSRRARELEAAVAAGRMVPATAPEVRREGDVVVVVDDGQIVRDRNLFDLEREVFRFVFKRRAKGYKLRNAGGGVSGDVGQRLGLGDDDSERVDLPFRARFFGGRYDRIWVNSDGNVTFEEGDNASTSRDLGRVLGGPPRVAPLFNDLDPSLTSGSDGVFVKTTPTFVRVTWRRVPEFGTSNSNTVQMTLFKAGKIVFAFGDVDAETAVVGISPGRGAGLDLVNFDEDAPTPIKVFAIAENFSNTLSVDEAALAQVVLTYLDDVYSHLVTFTDFPLILGGIGVVAYHINLRNRIRGIGRPRFDASRFFGSNGVLESFVQMGDIGKYPNNLRTRRWGTLTSLDVGVHEKAHRWLAFPEFRRGGQAPSQDLLGRQLAHWAFGHDSDASFMEGNEIRDNGDGTFTTLPRDAGFSPLDLYLMGLVAPADVPDFFYVADSGRPDRAPEFDQTFPGRRVDVSVGDVVRAEGRRDPGVEDSPKEFRIAWVLLARQGEPVSQGSIDQVDKFRRQATNLFEKATGNRADIDTRLVLK